MLLTVCLHNSPNRCNRYYFPLHSSHSTFWQSEILNGNYKNFTFVHDERVNIVHTVTHMYFMRLMLLHLSIYFQFSTYSLILYAEQRVTYEVKMCNHSINY